MEKWLLQHEGLLRLSVFITALALFWVWERISCWRTTLSFGVKRWVNHLMLVGTSTLMLRLLFPVLAMDFARVAEENQLGLLRDVDLPFGWIIFLSVLGLDLAIYIQHRMMHRYSLLWRLHKVHHIDTELDVTTGVRFHPFEAVFSMAFKCLAIGFIGAPVLAVFIFEIVLSVMSLFTHTNIHLNRTLETILRWVWVTPVMHRVHHSDIREDLNTNFGFCLSIWDRMCGTYQETRIVFGVEGYRNPKYQKFLSMLWLPFERRIKPKTGQRSGMQT